MKEFRLNTTVRIGPEAMVYLERYATSKVLLVTDEFLSTTKIFDRVKALLGDRVTVFKDVVPNPTTECIRKGTAAYLEAAPAVVVAFGGGSVIDAAKGMHMTALKAEAAAPDGMIAIPTTSGSGSEVTSFTVITDAQTHQKFPIVSTDMIPAVAILDPQVVKGVPPRTTADAGMDALSHAVEAYVSSEACDFSDALAEKAASLAFTYLYRCFVDGKDYEAREHMHNASCLAAMAFDNVGLGIVHSLSHAIGGWFPIAHGRINGILMPDVIDYNAAKSEHARERYALLGRVVSPASRGKAGIIALVSAIKKVRAQLEMPASVTEAGVDRQEFINAIPQMAHAAMEDRCTPTNPVQPSLQDLEALLHKVS